MFRDALYLMNCIKYIALCIYLTTVHLRSINNSLIIETSIKGESNTIVFNFYFKILSDF